MKPTQIIEAVADRAQAWAALDDGERARLIRACAKQLHAVRHDWVATACATKGVRPNSKLAGEEWIAGVAVSLRAMRLYAEVLEGKRQLDRLPLSESPSGRTRVQTHPYNFVEGLLMPGMRVEVELESAKSASQEARKTAKGGLALVLGAGNIDSILVFDLLDQLLRHKRVVVLKFNPVNAAIRAPMERAFAPLIEAGYLSLIEGDGAVGAELSVHPRVDAVHLTGSNASFDAMVWGSDAAESVRRRDADDPRVTATVSAELGAVTPVLVVPGAWSSSDIRNQARQVAAMAAHNASCNCNAAKLVVTARHWPQRGAFLDALRKELAKLPARPSWYPGSRERWSEFRERYEQGEEIAPKQTGVSAPGAAETLPWLFIPDVPLRRAELACQTEAFSPVLAECSIAAKTPEEFLTRVVDPVNEEVFGTLSCAVLAPPHVSAELLDQAIDRLEYGTLAVNTWPGLAFGLASPSWGAFPGHTLQRAGSGIGHVHEPFMLDGVRRSIVRAPFRPGRRPAYEAGHRRLLSLGRAWADWEAKPGMLRIIRLAIPATFG